MDACQWVAQQGTLAPQCLLEQGASRRRHLELRNRNLSISGYLPDQFVCLTDCARDIIAILLLVISWRSDDKDRFAPVQLFLREYGPILVKAELLSN